MKLVNFVHVCIPCSLPWGSGPPPITWFLAPHPLQSTPIYALSACNTTLNNCKQLRIYIYRGIGTNTEHRNILKYIACLQKTYRISTASCNKNMRWWGLGWQWHQLDHTRTICTSLQTDNHTNTSIFYRPDALPDAQPTVSKHWRHISALNTSKKR